MDFSLSEEQALLKNSVERFITDEYEFTARVKIAHSEQGWSAEHWALFAEQGWLAMPFAEEDGGLAFGPPEVMIMMEAFGRGLVLEPFFSTVVLGGGFLRRAAPDLRAEIVPQVIAGEHRLAFAHQEPGMRYNPAQVAFSARREADRYLLSGRKTVVVHGPDAASLIVSARTDGAPGEAAGVTLFHVPADAAGIEARSYRTVDGQPACDLHFTDVEATAIIGDLGGALPLIETVLAEAHTALAAEAVGCMSALLDQTLDYVKTRKQFGRPIGSFQVIQHRMADMFMAVERARSIMLLATLTHERGRTEWLRNVAAAMALIDRLSRDVGHEAIQLHGGIGMTDELSVGHYHKRLLTIQMLFGDAAHHTARFRALAA